jgi:predicted CxxxxCH...CXXCH cytochrome family protein
VEDVLNSASSDGKSGLADDPDPTGSTTAGAHQKHATSAGLNLACDTCHTGYVMPQSPSQIIDIGFNIFSYGGTNTKYDGQTTVDGYMGRNGTTVTQTGTLTCSNIYCHSIVQSDGGGSLTPDTSDYASPVWNDPSSVQCGSCHKADGVQGNATLMDTGSHTKHVNTSTYGFSCSKCHNGAGSGTSIHVNNQINVIFEASIGGSYGGDSGNTGNHAPGQGYGSCTSVYCHTDGNGGTPNTTPTWGSTLPTDCTGCHNNDASAASAMSSGSHSQHIGAGATTTIGRQLGCVDCHALTVSDNRTIADYTKHVNQTKDIWVNIDGKGCTDIKCHSSGNFDGTLTYNNPTWGVTTLDCTSCHGDGASKAYPSYADGGAGTGDSNSHNAHVGTNGINCEECHQFTSVDGTAINGTDPTKHVNQTVDISFKQGGTYNAGTESCSSTYCHGTGTPQWGATGTVNCGDCHAVNNTLAGKHSVHYDSATNADATDRTTAANNSTATNYEFSCAVCHNGATHAGGAVGGGQTAEISFDATVAGGGTYTPSGTTDTDPNGFGYTYGSCSSTYCHSDGAGGGPNTIPSWDPSVTFDCKSCHSYTAASGTPMASGKHTAHVGTSASPKYAFNCSKCHNATTDGSTITDKTKHINHTKDVVFDTLNPSGTFDSGTKACSSLYCHSDGNGGAPNVSVDWATATLPTDCTGCHDNNAAATPNTMSTGGHTAHINKGTIMTDKTCDTCHTSTVSGDRTIVDYTLHVNGTKNITINATYDGDTTPENNYSSGQCSNLYCHSDATSLTGPYNAPNTVPTWGTTTNLGCSDCHTGPPTGPDYTNGSPKANSHNKHVVVNGYTCDTCHQATTSDGTTITDPTKHLNKQYDVSGTDIGGYTYNAAGGTCTNISCHGGNDAQWGGTVSCSDCHLGTGDVDDYVYNNGTTARLDSTEWTSSGHGRTTGTYSASGNSAANLSCEYCHDGTVGHGTATNPFRLANYNVGGNGWNDVCFICHQTGSSGYDPDGGGPLALKNSSLKIDKYHYGAKHGASNDGGSLCFDCHDPHGDSNIYMVHDNVTKDKADAYGTPASTGAPVFTANTTGTDYAKSSSPFNGVCNVCHTSTNHYTSSSGDGHNSGTRCTTCHSHSGDTVVNGDAFKPSGDCDSCHGYPPTPGDGYVYQDDPVQEGKGAHAQHVSHIAALKGVTLDPANDSFGTGAPGIVCGTCHTNDSANHMSGTRVINFGDGSSEYQFGPNAPVYNGVPGTSSTVNPKTCSNVSCHFKDSPAWQDPSAPK